jgi:hypothetical protein
VILTGDVPSPVNPPDGCRFHTRCWLYERLGRPEQCRTVDPELRVVETEHRAACHFAEEALQSDVGVAVAGEAHTRRGTPDSATAGLAAEQADAAAVSEAATARSSTPTTGDGDEPGS